MGLTMRHNFPGLYRDTLRSGRVRYVVRMEGNPKRKTALPVGIGPDHPAFIEHYYTARAGERFARGAPAEPPQETGTLDWLAAAYLAHLAAEVTAGQKSPLTLRARTGVLRRFCDLPDLDGERYGTKRADEMPRRAVIAARDSIMATPAAADTMVKAVKAMFVWAIDQDHVAENPAQRIRRLHKGGKGATPWRLDDIRKYRDRHAVGTVARLALELALYTGARRDDLPRLGRHNEVAGRLVWQPGKKGSAQVSLPLAPAFASLLRSCPVVGPTYLLTAHGRPFASGNAFANRFRTWCAEAGIEGRSLHGIRKAMAVMARESGVSTEGIMALLSHTEAQTTEIYTRDADRARLASEAIERMWES